MKKIPMPINLRRIILRGALGAVSLILSGLVPFAWAANEATVALVGHVPRQIQTAALVGRAPADEPVDLSLAVHVDQTLLDQTFNQLYGPHAPTKKQFLSSSDFAQRFELAGKRQAIKTFAQSNGLTIMPMADVAESMVVKVSAPASVVEKAFHVHLNHYRGTDGRTFRANDTDPMVPASLTPHLGAVVGLNTLSGLWHSHVKRFSPNQIPSLVGTTGHGGSGLSPADIKTVYGLTGTSLSGSGQTIALYELDGYVPSDIATYETQFGLPSITVTPISVNGATNVCGSGCDEVELDIEVAAALAPGVSKILVYEAPPLPNTTFNDVLDAYDRIAADDLAQQVSTSWGGPEIPNNNGSFLQSESQIFERMAVQGQSFFSASGDNGAYDDETTVSVDDPASQPFVTGVGGTQLSGSVASPVETVWNGCGTGKCLQSSFGSTGGGVSTIWPISGAVNSVLYNYQVGVSGTASQTQRNVPDVSLCAGAPGYSVFIGGWGLVGGTSAAAPLWAAFMALVNEDRLAGGQSLFGFANPALYPFASGTTYSSVFNDIQSGDNGFYSAGTGYDNATGLGSFKGIPLINAISTLQIQPFKVITPQSVYAYPNPWDVRNPKITSKIIYIANVPTGNPIKIFTLSGFFVKTITSIGQVTPWDMTNDAGKTVASGLYFYIANDGTAMRRGTIAIIR